MILLKKISRPRRMRNLTFADEKFLIVALKKGSTFPGGNFLPFLSVFYIDFKALSDYINATVYILSERYTGT